MESQPHARTDTYGLIEVHLDEDTAATITQAAAVTLLAELAAELLERHDPGATIGRALGDLLDAISDALTRRGES